MQHSDHQKWGVDFDNASDINMSDDSLMNEINMNNALSIGIVGV